MAAFKALAAALLVLATIQTVFACNGFKLEIKKIDSKCKDKDSNIVMSPDFKIVLTEDCKMTSSGCLEILKGFGVANITYNIKSALGVPLTSGEVCGCDVIKEAKKYPDAEMMMDLFQVPKECPVRETKICGDGKTVDVSKYKDHLMPGAIKGEIVIQHDNDLQSCMHFEGGMKK